ncbi:MAG: DUF885 domain-containing protein [Gammaproteobacteria bacterium]|nr:DUF885 domain-containing protein [Gammaproteobacteria bacterium]MDH4314298.1 DUF885 domain-containing protein [Gammaproteobacteria bacterium]
MAFLTSTSPTLKKISCQMASLFLAMFCISANVSAAGSYADLVELFDDWREFERPPMKDGAPDYTASRFDAAFKELGKYRARLDAIDPGSWPLEQQVDWHIVRAEMNGFDFNHRVLKPWVRDPAYYQSVWMARSDVPAHEGPANHALLEFWTYSLPLSAGERQRLIGDLQVIPPLLAQARGNLTGNAGDLWHAGIKNIRDQVTDLEVIASAVNADSDAELAAAIGAASSASAAFVEWLEQQAPSKTGPSGVGKDNYTWYQQNVHYVPYTWEQEVTLLRRELERAWSSLELEEHRNRNEPPLVAISSAEEYEHRADLAATRFMAFLDEQDILTVKDYMEPALREHLGRFVPPEQRNFFQIAMHYDPTTLYAHFYHWFELAQMDNEPHASPVRRGALLYNIFDSRNEGTATAVEEMFMHAGLYDDNPHVREIVWIMLAQRAARGLGSLYAHANIMTMAEAGEFHAELTPRNWMSKELDLLAFEQHLYLRQPGYGTSYITGKILLERLLADRSKQMNGDLSLSRFFDELNQAGGVPISLVSWQLTGNDAHIRTILGTE